MLPNFYLFLSILTLLLAFISILYTSPHHNHSISSLQPVILPFSYSSSLFSNPTLPLLQTTFPQFEYHPIEISFLIQECIELRKRDIDFENNSTQCSLSDSIPVLTTPNSHQHQPCLQLQEILTNQYILCTYDTTHCIHKANIKQPIIFIKTLYKQYFSDKMQIYIRNLIHHQETSEHISSNPRQSLIHSSPPPTSLLSSQPLSSPRLPQPPQHLPTTNSTLTDDQSFQEAQILHYYAQIHLSLFEKHIDSIRSIFGIYAKCGIKHIDSIYTKSYRSQILKTEPWYNISYIRDALRAKVRINSFYQIKPILSLLSSFGYHITQADYEKFLEPKIWGWRPIAIDLRYYLNPHDIRSLLTPQQQSQLDISLFSFNNTNCDEHQNQGTKSNNTDAQCDQQSTFLRNTGFIIELYFVPSHMDLKEVKSYNHHIYEKWRNLPILPTFQDYYQQYYTVSTVSTDSTSKINQVASNFHTKASNDLRVASQTPTPTPTSISTSTPISTSTSAPTSTSVPTSISISTNQTTHHIEESIEKEQQKLHDIEEVIEKEQKKLHDIDFSKQHFYSFVPLTPADEDLYSMWIEFLNDVFWSSYSYTNALERFALEQFSFISSEPFAFQQFSSISSIESSFREYISQHLLKCDPQCQKLWEQRTQYDIISYLPSSQFPNQCEAKILIPR